jgi:hypothetical protein
MSIDFMTILIALVILIAIFFVLREVNCWYWKINERISLQKEQNLILREILTSLKSESNSKKTVSNETINQPSEKVTDEELMNKYGITLQGDKYFYKNYKYERLIDAVNYAKQFEKSN